ALKASSASNVQLASHGARRAKLRALAWIWVIWPGSKARSFPLIVYELRGLSASVKGFAAPAQAARISNAYAAATRPPGRRLPFPPGSGRLQSARLGRGRPPLRSAARPEP